jgi:integrase
MRGVQVRGTQSTILCSTLAHTASINFKKLHEHLIIDYNTPSHFHDLRHAHATHLLAAGVHPKVASERLGHSKVGITLDLYSHVMPGMQEDAVLKVEAALKAGQGLS